MLRRTEQLLARRLLDSALAALAVALVTHVVTVVLFSAINGATVEVLTYARSLASGDIVQPADVVWSTVQAHQAPAGGPQDADQVVGLSAKRALRAGAAVTSRDLASPQVIARNDMVEVAYISGGVELTVTGKATRDASAGAPPGKTSPPPARRAT